MKLDGISTRSILALGGITLALGSSATAQQIDQAVYDRWAPIVVVHYVIVGVYENDTAAVSQLGTGGTRAKAHVKDRFEIAFDWDQSELSIVGTPGPAPASSWMTAIAACWAGSLWCAG